MASNDLTTKISDLSTRVGEELAKMTAVTVMHSPADTREDVIAAGSEFEVPAYAVGTSQLQVYLDGVLCAETETYTEVESGVIAFADDIPVDFDILVKVR